MTHVKASPTTLGQSRHLRRAAPDIVEPADQRSSKVPVKVTAPGKNLEEGHAVAVYTAYASVMEDDRRATCLQILPVIYSISAILHAYTYSYSYAREPYFEPYI